MTTFPIKIAEFVLRGRLRAELVTRLLLQNFQWFAIEPMPGDYETAWSFKLIVKAEQQAWVQGLLEGVRLGLERAGEG